MHEPAAAPAYVPASHGVHSSAPSAEYVPAEHVSHSQCVAAYSPAAHVTLSLKGLQPLRGTDTVSGEARGRGKSDTSHTASHDVSSRRRWSLITPASPSASSTWGAPRILFLHGPSHQRPAAPSDSSTCPAAANSAPASSAPARQAGLPASAEAETAEEAATSAATARAALVLSIVKPFSDLLLLAGPKVLARDRAPRPFYSRTTKLVNAWKVLPCCRQTAARCARAAPESSAELAQIRQAAGSPRRARPLREGPDESHASLGRDLARRSRRPPRAPPTSL